MTEANKTKAKTPLIYKQIAAMMGDVKKIAKDRKNPHQNYKFRGIDDVYNSVHDIFAKHKVFTVPEVINAVHEERKSHKGGVLIYRILTIKYTFFAEDGSFIETIVIGEAMDSGDKAGNKAMSVAHKYALLQILLIPTDDPKDPEIDSPEVNGEPGKINQGKGKKESYDPLVDDVAYEGEEDERRKEEFKTITIKHFDGKQYKISKFDALDLFSKMKDQIGKETYYEILGGAGYEKSNQIPPKKIPVIYALMVEAYQGK